MLFDVLPGPVRDAIYVAVGLPIVAAQEVHARQQELATEWERRAAPLRVRAETVGRRAGDLVPSFQVPALDRLNDRVEEQVKALEERLNEIEARVEEALDRIEGQLPDSAREVVSQARGAAKEARTQLRSLVNRAA